MSSKFTNEIISEVDIVVPLPVNERVEECLQWVEHCDDIPAEDDDSYRQMEPHRPHQNGVDDIRQPADVENHVDQRELELEHVVDLPLVIRVLSVALNQLSVDFSAALHINHWVRNHDKQDSSIIQDVVRHHTN